MTDSPADTPKAEPHDNEQPLEQWLATLAEILDAGADIVASGRDAFRSDPALRLSCEALIARVGDVARALVVLDPERFHDPLWSLAAHNHDLVVHHDNRVDEQSLWMIITEGFPELAELASMNLSVRREE